jgi:hypothetical protein
MAIGRGTRDMGTQRKLVLEARKWGKPVHGFAMTKINTTLKWVPYDSVDSTSVWMAQKYGSLAIFKNNKWKILTGDQKGLRKNYRKYFTSIGCDYRKIEADDVAEVRKASVIAWRNLAERFQLLKVRREAVYPVGAVGIDDGFSDETEPVILDAKGRSVPLTRDSEGGNTRSVGRNRGTERVPVVETTGTGIPVVQTEVTSTRSRPLARFGVPIEDPNRKRVRPQER